MTPEQAQENINACIKELSEKVPLFIFDPSETGESTGKDISFANDIVAYVKRRVTLLGHDKNGKPFPYPYTSVYQAMKSGESRIASTKKTLKSGKKSKGKKYGNKDAGFRNFVYSGSLMGNYKAFKDGNEYKIGFENDEAKEIAEGNSYGHHSYKGVGTNIIEPSKEEIDKATRFFEERILKILKKYMA